MSTLFLIENDVALWKGTPVQHSDFANIREFVDACLKPDKAPPHLRPDLTSDFDQLLKLVSVLDSTIPWPSIEQLSNAIPEIPPPPPKPTMPFNPSGVPLKIDEAAKHLAKLTLELDALNTRIKDGEFGLSFKQNKLTTEKAACNTYISQLSEWKKAMAQWHIATDEYNQQLPQFKRKVGHHKRLITTYQSSILHKKIIKRLVLDLNAAISNGGLVFD
ncbi:hypothetical protein JIN77_02640 [Verrucomicrobiaceae bacterium R5-34]|nr:hypothetical protein [Verrucomicrobiaceae bacterium R5-34]